MAGMTSPSAAPAPPPDQSAAGTARPPVLSTALAATGLAPDMAAQFERVLGAARPDGLSGVSSDQALAVVVAAEAVKAWADSISMDATAVMVTEIETDFAHQVPEGRSSRTWRLFYRWCRSAAAREIQLVTGLPITACQRRVWLTACEPERVGALREAMGLGRVTLARAITLAEATKHLDGPTAAAIGSRVLAPLTGPDGVPLPGMAPLSEATFRARLHRQLVLHHGLIGLAERSHTQAVAGRRLSNQPQRDGTGLILISGDGPRIAAAQGRVDTIARRLRTCGDARNLDQLRADVATDLLMRGWIPSDPTFTQLGEPPAAIVQLITSLPSILGIDHGVGHLAVLGDVPGQRAVRERNTDTDNRHRANLHHLPLHLRSPRQQRDPHLNPGSTPGSQTRASDQPRDPLARTLHSWRKSPGQTPWAPRQAATNPIHLCVRPRRQHRT
jgi:hypothetical protein